MSEKIFAAIIGVVLLGAVMLVAVLTNSKTIPPFWLVLSGLIVVPIGLGALRYADGGKEREVVLFAGLVGIFVVTGILPETLLYSWQHDTAVFSLTFFALLFVICLAICHLACYRYIRTSGSRYK